MTGRYKVSLNEKIFVVGSEELTNLHIGIHEESFWDKPKFDAWGATDWNDDIVNQKAWVRHDINAGDKIYIECLTSEKATPPEDELTSGPYEDSCSFCNKEKSEVEVLIKGPDSWICNECVDVCVEVIENKRNNKP